MIRSRRFVALGWHALASLSVAAMAALVVFLCWYPPPYFFIAGGLSLFALIVGVDVVLGPLLTGVIASPGKPAGELRRDIAVIVVVQLAALAYGLYTLALARPVYVVFEIDRMRVVTAADVEPGELAKAPVELRELSWTGPRLIAAVKPTDAADQMRSVELGLAGFDLSMVPSNWRDFASQREASWRAARPIAQLIARYPDANGPAKELAAKAGLPLESLRFMPLLSRQASWVVLWAGPNATIAGYLPFDGFF